MTDTHKIDDYLRLMIDQNASDLYLTTAAPAQFRVEGKLVSPVNKKLPAGLTTEYAKNLLGNEKWEIFEQQQELNIAHSVQGTGRFRMNFFLQRGEIAIVVRLIKTQIPTPKTLTLPPILSELITQKHGFFIVVGATNSGKSTTVASLVNYRASYNKEHIITIEDPVEFLYHHGNSIINQREIGLDTQSFQSALSNALRQTPDMVVIGEIHNRQVMEQAIAFADTGHYCISTLHATNCQTAIERVTHFYPAELRDKILSDLSYNLQAIVSQRLVPSVTGKRILASEVLICTPLVKEAIKLGQFNKLKDIMAKSGKQGMHTFDDDLFRLCREGEITEEQALLHADSANNIKVKLNMHRANCVSTNMSAKTLNFSIDEDQNRTF